MKIKSIASSSSGNAHIIEIDNKQVLLDCGVSLKKIRQALDYDLSKVVGCFASHSHHDHCSPGLTRIERETNIQIYTTEQANLSLGLKNSIKLYDRAVFDFDSFSVVSLAVNHDVECYAFLIDSKFGQLLYATDTGSIDYTIPGLKYLMIEANHEFEKLIDSELNRAAVKRISETHLDIDQVCEFVERHKDLQEIHLLHLSSGHSDADKFQKMVQDVSGCPVYVAEK